MTGVATASSKSSETGAGFLAGALQAYLWLATLTERIVPAGDDGKHIPDNVRRIIETRNFYI